MENVDHMKEQRRDNGRPSLGYLKPYLEELPMTRKGKPVTMGLILEWAINNYYIALYCVGYHPERIVALTRSNPVGGIEQAIEKVMSKEIENERHENLTRWFDRRPYESILSLQNLLSLIDAPTPFTIANKPVSLGKLIGSAGRGDATHLFRLGYTYAEISLITGEGFEKIARRMDLFRRKIDNLDEERAANLERYMDMGKVPTRGEVVKHPVCTDEHTVVVVLDEPGAGGAKHEYVVTDHGGDVLARVNFQKGVMAEAGVNGCHNEDLILIALDRLRDFNAGEFACRENALAITSLESALHWLRQRDAWSQGTRGVRPACGLTVNMEDSKMGLFNWLFGRPDEEEYWERENPVHPTIEVSVRSFGKRNKKWRWYAYNEWGKMVAQMAGSASTEDAGKNAAASLFSTQYHIVFRERGNDA